MTEVNGWKLYRHREAAGVRYWVRGYCDAVFQHVGSDEHGWWNEEAVEIRCPRNAAGYGSEGFDLLPHQCPDAGLLPRSALERLYEEVEV